MNKFIRITKALLNAIMTIILIVGILFIFLYIIGIEPFIVRSGSMEPAIQTGSLSFINKHIKYENIKENDVIAYVATTGDKVTHRAIKITEEGIETKGDSNDNSDGISTTKNNYIGKNVFSIPKLGYFVVTIQTTRGRVILITFIIVLLLAGFLYDDKPKEK